MTIEQAVLIAQKRGLRMEMKLIVEQHKLLVSEIQLRNKMIQDLLKKHMNLQDQCQAIADKLLKIEYDNLVENNI